MSPRCFFFFLLLILSHCPFSSQNMWVREGERARERKNRWWKLDSVTNLLCLINPRCFYDQVHSSQTPSGQRKDKYLEEMNWTFKCFGREREFQFRHLWGHFWSNRCLNIGTNESKNHRDILLEVTSSQKLCPNRTSIFVVMSLLSTSVW